MHSYYSTIYEQNRSPFHLDRITRLLFLLGNGSLFRDVNSIKKLSQILFANVGSLLDLCTRERHHGNVIANETNFILDIGTSNVFDSRQKLDLADTLFSQKVSNLDCISRQCNIDWEMRIDKAHLVDEPLSDTGNHVINVRADGSDASKLFASSKPEINLNSISLVSFFVFVFNNSAVHGNVLEVAFKSAAGSSHFDFTSIALDFDCESRRRDDSESDKS